MKSERLLYVLLRAMAFQWNRIRLIPLDNGKRNGSGLVTENIASNA
jgi:hypothetical protein